MAEKLGAKCGILLVGLISVVLGAFSPSPASAQADELRAFEQARQAYTDANYPLAVQRFEALVGGAVPTIQNAALVLESRKYLGAAYLFVGRPSEADRQFEALLRTDPDYLIPATFPEAVQEAFDAARHRLAQQASAHAADDARRERERREAEMRHLVAQQERIRRLEELARVEVVEHENSRALALLPFGIGQFQNEDQRLGRFLLYSEGALSLVSLGTAITRAILRGRAANLDPTFRRRSRRSLVYTNWAATGSLAIVGLAGIIQAQVRFRPRIRHERPRDLSIDDADPDSTDVPSGEDMPEEPAAEVSLQLSPTHLGLTVQF